MIYVVRHGQTDLNKEGRLQGRKGLPLNSYGVQQAELLRNKLIDVNFDLVDFIKRVFSFLHELKAKYSGIVTNILISGHRCTTGCIGAYFEGIPEDGNISRFSSNNGDYKVYTFK